MDVDFSGWLSHEMKERQLGVRELARLTGSTAATISRVVNEMRGPGPELCQKLARALDLPETVVFEQAGLLSPARGEGELTRRELYELLKDLPVEEQRAILAEARRSWARRQAGTTCTDPAAG